MAFNPGPNLPQLFKSCPRKFYFPNPEQDTIGQLMGLYPGKGRLEVKKLMYGILYGKPLFPRRKEMDRYFPTQEQVEQELESRLDGIAAVENIERLGDGAYHVTMVYSAMPGAMPNDFNIAGTQTGRFSSELNKSAIPQQNIPLPAPPIASHPNGVVAVNAPPPMRPDEENAEMSRKTVLVMNKVRQNIRELRQEMSSTDPRNPKHMELAERIADQMNEYAYQTSLLRQYSDI
jgi:hypothetical protein